MYLCANEWRALVQQYGAVFCLQQLCSTRSQAHVGLLIDLLTSSIIKSQTNLGVSLALKAAVSLRHHCLERAAATAHVEEMQRFVRPFTDVQFQTNGDQIPDEVRFHESGRHHAMPEIADGGQLGVVSCQNHHGSGEANFCDHIQQRTLAHKAFVQAQRAFEKTFLDPVLEPGESFAGVELATRNVRSSHASDLVQQLQAATSQMRLAAAWRAENHEWLPLTCQLQSELLDITFAFTENLDSWQHVRCHTGLLVEDDAFLLLTGQLAIENAEELPLTSSALDQAFAWPEPPLGLMQRFASSAQKHLLGFFGQ